jgi:hypothetical protein
VIWNAKTSGFTEDLRERRRGGVKHPNREKGISSPWRRTGKSPVRRKGLKSPSPYHPKTIYTKKLTLSVGMGEWESGRMKRFNHGWTRRNTDKKEGASLNWSAFRGFVASCEIFH